jgi:MoaA/NifB/PqqE/SkfB family radical SAM enzyme
MCAREGCEDWLSGDMSQDNFRKITHYLKDVERVVLEGWGESLLNKDLIEIVRMAKAEGPEVGFVTSGMGLKKGKIIQLLDAGVDFMGFSISGSSPGVHGDIRINSDLELLLSDIELIQKEMDVRELTKPKLHIAYLMLKDNISEVISIVELGKKIGITDIILLNIIQISNEYQDELKVFTCDEKNGYEEIVKEAEVKANDLNINLKRPAMTPVEVMVCEENPLRNLYISVDGEVSPCVYLHPPMPSPFKRIFCGVGHDTEKLNFGNIFRESFGDVWNKQEYIDFRSRFMQRKKKSEFSPLMDLESLKKSDLEPLPDPPRHCMTCHKMLGV